MYYRILSDEENFANFLPKNYTNELAKKFDGRSHLKGWTELHFELVDPKDERPIPEIITGYIPIISQRVYEKLKNHTFEGIEFLPCTLGKNNNKYYVMNVTNIISCIDYENSKYKSFPSTGRIMFFEHIALEKIIEDPVFRICDLPYNFYFCTEKFKNILEEINPKGLMFSNALFKNE